MWIWEKRKNDGGAAVREVRGVEGIRNLVTRRINISNRACASQERCGFLLNLIAFPSLPMVIPTPTNCVDLDVNFFRDSSHQFTKTNTKNAIPSAQIAAKIMLDIFLL